MGGGNDNTLSLLELIHMINEETNDKVNYEFDEWRPSDQKVFISDIRKANKLLNRGTFRNVWSEPLRLDTLG